MELKVIGSGSNGNCYVLTNGRSALIIECGMPFKDVMKAIDFKPSIVAGAILTHEHNDHSKYVAEFLQRAIIVATSMGTWDALGGKTLKYAHNQFSLRAGDKYEIGEFKVIPFDVKHDAAQPYGFVINHPECGNVLFITDTCYVENRFANLDNIIIEANYSREVMSRRFLADEIDVMLKNRVMSSHMSLETCKKALQANDLSRVNNIILIHLSDGNSDEREFQKTVTEATGKAVHVASKGKVFNLSVTPF